MTPTQKKYLLISATLFLGAFLSFKVYSFATSAKANPLSSQVLPAPKPTVTFDGSEESEVQDYKRPAYFSIFKFIISFLPGSER
jgi:hypothetical protein